jgi:hypothetical protein
MRAPTGAILTTTITSKAGRCMKAIGTAKITVLVVTTTRITTATITAAVAKPS